MAVQVVQNVLKRLSRSFIDAVLSHVEPVFNEAASGGDGSGAGDAFGIGR